MGHITKCQAILKHGYGRFRLREWTIEVRRNRLNSQACGMDSWDIWVDELIPLGMQRDECGLFNPKCMQDFIEAADEAITDFTNELLPL